MIGVGVIGTGGIGRNHLRGWGLLAAAREYADVRIAAVSGRPGAGAQAQNPPRYDDWRGLVDDPAVDVVDICTPDGLHAEMASYALQAGKHVVCEKPLEVGADAVVPVGSQTGVCHVYRNLPSAAYVRTLVADGALGEILEVRGRYLQEWALDPANAGRWRLRGEDGGVTGDLGTHVLDLAAFLLPSFASSRVLSAASTDPVRRMTWSTLSDDGILGTFAVSRTARGWGNHLQFEICGSLGTATFALEHPLDVHLASAGTRSFDRRQIDERTHREFLEGWWPAGARIGYADLFAHQFADLVERIRDPRAAVGSATFEDGRRADGFARRIRALAAEVDAA